MNNSKFTIVAIGVESFPRNGNYQTSGKLFGLIGLGLQIPALHLRPCICLHRPCPASPTMTRTSTEIVSTDTTLNEKSNSAACYIVIEEPLSWEQAVKKCEQYEGYLATPNTDLENKFIKNQLNKIYHNTERVLLGEQIWFGANKSTEKNDQSVFVNNIKLDYSDWINGNPSGGNEDCLTFCNVGDFRWNDAACGTGFYFICETKG